LAEIYKEYRQGFFSLAMSVTRNAAEAEDAVHDAFVKLASKDIQIKGKAVPYVFAVVRNAALDRLRKRKKIVDVPEFIFDEQLSEEKAPGLSLQERERDFIIRKELEKLDEPQREVIILKLFSGLTFEEISEITGEPLSTVSSRYARTLKSLKYKMESLV
ncbi:MAG: sigma-70 family RNA polymerase sigma factor, partial [Lentisphaeraceae bacterium]|nr:sigma-70 family RNA polymerase sigma factor [Lentisphaeraceae bacterium]